MSSLVLRGTPDPSAAAVYSSAVVTRVRPGLYRFTVDPEGVAGCYWGSVTWTPALAASPVTTQFGPVGLPEMPEVMVHPDVLLWRIGVTDVDATLREQVRLAVLDAQQDVRAFLSRPVLPVERVVRGVWPAVGAVDLTDARAWPTVRWDDAARVVGWEDTGDAGWDVWWMVGLDPTVGDGEPVARFVAAHAANTPVVARIWRDTVGEAGARIVTSASTEGQSIGWQVQSPMGTATDLAGAAGSLPTLESLAHLKRLHAFRRPAPTPERWPYSGVRL